MKFGMFILLLFLIMTNINAHEKHKHKEKTQDTVQSVPEQEQANEIEKTGTHQHSVSKQEHWSEKVKINYAEHIFSHLHNKLVHFPVALSSIAFLFTWLSFKWKEFEFSIKWIVSVAAIISIAVLFTGLNQAEVFTGEPGEWVVNIHKLFGILTMLSLLLWTCFLFVRKLKRFAWLISIICFILIVITAFYGGIVAHGI